MGMANTHASECSFVEHYLKQLRVEVNDSALLLFSYHVRAIMATGKQFPHLLRFKSISILEGEIGKSMGKSKTLGKSMS